MLFMVSLHNNTKKTLRFFKIYVQTSKAFGHNLHRLLNQTHGKLRQHWGDLFWCRTKKTQLYFLLCLQKVTWEAITFTNVAASHHLSLLLYKMWQTVVAYNQSNVSFSNWFFYLSRTFLCLCNVILCITLYLRLFSEELSLKCIIFKQ